MKMSGKARALSQGLLFYIYGQVWILASTGDAFRRILSVKQGVRLGKVREEREKHAGFSDRTEPVPDRRCCLYGMQYCGTFPAERRNGVHRTAERFPTRAGQCGNGLMVSEREEGDGIVAANRPDCGVVPMFPGLSFASAGFPSKATSGGIPSVRGGVCKCPPQSF